MSLLYANPSRYLRTLAAIGRPADVALLSRLGPSTCLFVDSQPFRAESEPCDPMENPYELDPRSAFLFYCDALEKASRVCTIANLAETYSMHLQHVVMAKIPRLMYLLLASIESHLVGLNDNVVNLLESDAATREMHSGLLSQSFYSSPWPPTYGIKPPKEGELREDCTCASFLLGRSAELGSPCQAVLQSALFTKHISLYVFNQAIVTSRTQEKAGALKVSFLPVEVAHRLFDPELKAEGTVLVKLTADAQKLAEASVHREPETCSSIFETIARDRGVVYDLIMAGEGDITLGVTEHRLKYVRRLTDEEIAFEQERRRKEAEKTKELGRRLAYVGNDDDDCGTEQVMQGPRVKVKCPDQEDDCETEQEINAPPPVKYADPDDGNSGTQIPEQVVKAPTLKVKYADPDDDVDDKQ